MTESFCRSFTTTDYCQLTDDDKITDIKSILICWWAWINGYFTQRLLQNWHSVGIGTLAQHCYIGPASISGTTNTRYSNIRNAFQIEICLRRVSFNRCQHTAICCYKSQLTEAKREYVGQSWYIKMWLCLLCLLFTFFWHA